MSIIRNISDNIFKNAFNPESSENPASVSETCESAAESDPEIDADNPALKSPREPNGRRDLDTNSAGKPPPRIPRTLRIPRRIQWNTSRMTRIGDE